MPRRLLLPTLLLGTASMLACSSDPDETPSPSPNSPPVVTALELLPSTQVLPGDQVLVSVTVEDPEGDAVSLLWSALEGAFDDASALSTTFLVPDRLGYLTLTLEMTDERGATSSFSTELRVGYVVTEDGDGDGYTWEEGDCDDLDPSMSPAAQEAVDGRDNDCDGWVDEGSLVSDDDGDLWSELDGDCDDSNPSVFPTHAETAEGPQEGVDNDCDGLIDEDTDHYDDDEDGFSEVEGDCLDSSASAYPGALELADGLDNDCDGTIDEETVRSDDDGDGLAELDGDCDDSRSEVYPQALEVMDEVDNDCDGLIDEASPETDDDGDGFSDVEGDCDDSDRLTYPDAKELADGADNDCDLLVDEGTVRYDDDGDGLSESEGDCDDTDPSVYPNALELLDGQDNDCDGLKDEDTTTYDGDGDGFSTEEGDCDDFNPMVAPDASEMPDGLDNDCDTLIDEGTFRYDDDLDGYSELEGDCDDTRADVYPGALELDDGQDNNCDGVGDPNDPPLAVASLSGAERVCDEILLDASASTDPNGDTLARVYWYIAEKPEGSVVTDAWIVDQTAMTTSMTADKAGTYTVGLIVSDGVSSSEPDFVTFELAARGSNTDPIAEAGEDLERKSVVTCLWTGASWVCPACTPWTVTLDASASTDAELDRLFYSWSVSSSNTSAYSLTGQSSARPTLTLQPPLAEHGRTNTYSLFLKLEVRDCENEKDVDSVMVTYSCTGG